MPIKRRFGERAAPTETVKAESPRPQKERTPPAPKVREKKERTRPVSEGKARLAVKVDKDKLKVAKRWPQSNEQYVTVENGVVSVRTPKECTKWSHEFRLRIVRDYRPPNTLVDRWLLDKYDPETVYEIGGRRLMFRQPSRDLDNAKTKAVIIRTEVVDLTDNKAMFLVHADPAMRIMMVYAFLKRMSFDGVASFTVYDWQPE